MSPGVKDRMKPFECGDQQEPARPVAAPNRNWPDLERVFILSGKVMMDDGTPPPEPVVIERVCNGVPRRETYTDSKGHFTFTPGQNQQIMQDASESSADGI